ncbi:MAG: hypothetical protein R3F20_00265 [Planctomycetota bacterium]
MVTKPVSSKTPRRVALAVFALIAGALWWRWSGGDETLRIEPVSDELAPEAPAEPRRAPGVIARSRPEKEGLAPPASFVVEVVEAYTEVPIVGARVVLVIDARARRRRLDADDIVDEVVTDRSGRAVMRTEGAIDALRAIASAPGYAGDWARDLEGRGRIRISLAPVAPLEVLVQDHHAAPLEDVVVFASRTSIWDVDRDDARPAGADPETAIHRARTDVEGRAVFTELVPGRYLIRARRDFWVTSVAPDSCEVSEGKGGTARVAMMPLLGFAIELGPGERFSAFQFGHGGVLHVDGLQIQTEESRARAHLEREFPGHGIGVLFARTDEKSPDGLDLKVATLTSRLGGVRCDLRARPIAEVVSEPLEGEDPFAPPFRTRLCRVTFVTKDGDPVPSDIDAFICPVDEDGELASGARVMMGVMATSGSVVAVPEGRYEVQTRRFALRSSFPSHPLDLSRLSDDDERAEPLEIVIRASAEFGLVRVVSSARDDGDGPAVDLRVATARTATGEILVDGGECLLPYGVYSGTVRDVVEPSHRSGRSSSRSIVPASMSWSRATDPGASGRSDSHTVSVTR